MSNRIIFLYIVSVLLLWPNLTLAEDGRFSVILSEVCFLPKEGESEWVEVMNISAKPVNISGWKITNGDFTFVLPKNLRLIPGNHLLIIFDGKDKTEYKDGVYMVHSFRGIDGDVLGNAVAGECALYDTKEKMMAFVAWGDYTFESELMADAVKEGVWLSLNHVVLVQRRVGGVVGPIKEIKRGGTIGVYDYPEINPADANEWVVYDPDEVSPGMLNPLARPVLHLPENGDHITEMYDMSGHLTSSMSFGCAKIPGADRYRFQLCRDKDCNDILKEGVEDYIVWKVDLKPGHHYYWRVMTIDTRTGRKSSWSRVNKLSYGYFKNSLNENGF